MVHAGQGRFQILSFREGQTSDSRLQNYKSRRPHRKSQKGCLICKRRRIKCDEQSPTCQNYWFPHTDSTLFSYFITVVMETMVPLSSWTTAAQKVVSIALDEPLAMHSVLAAAGCHFRYHVKSPRGRCLSETYHTMRACSGLRLYLEMQQVDKIDAAITTSMFLGSISFADMVEDFQVPLKNRQVPFFWVGSQRGLGSLLTLFRFKPSLQSMWLDVFEPVAEALLGLYDDRPGVSGIPAEFATVFDLSETSNCDDHPYLKLLRRLWRLLPVDPGNELALLLYMQFVEGMSSQFVVLLNSLDTRALMLVSYWLALICAKDCWWTRLRAKNDCWAICEHLEQVGDKSLWKYMDFPAAACGYPYTDVAPAGQRMVDWLRLDSIQRPTLHPASNACESGMNATLASNVLEVD
ncbi:hypothetical protein CLAIMM_06794 [Cladophialophora immunda]|nr:hypothetical protein CLAIMM_06794 [Cladophialophora immunda]